MTVLFDDTLTRKEKLSSEYLLDTHSPLPFMVTVRKTLEEWFTHYSQEQKKEFLSRFRKDDASYSGALLELVTHEILRNYAGRVRVEDALPSGSRPDFHLKTPGGSQLWVECTVAQRSDALNGAINTARRLYDVVNSIDTTPFGLSWELMRHSKQAQPRETALKRHIRDCVDDLVNRIAGHSIEKGCRLDVTYWEDRGWRIRFEFFYLPNRRSQSPAIVMNGGESAGINEENEGWMGNDVQKLRSALEYKADQLKYANGSCIIAISHSDLILDNTGVVLAGALFENPDTYGSRRSFYGSADSPSNQHVTGVLYFPWVKAHMFCSKETPWFYVPHPWSLSPLSDNIFDFARRGTFKPDGEFQWSAPLCAINEVLGLPADWPGIPPLSLRLGRSLV